MTDRVQNAMLRHWASMLNAKGFYEWSPEAEAAVQEMAASYLAEENVPVGTEAYEDGVRRFLSSAATALEGYGKAEPVVVKHFFEVLGGFMDHPVLAEQDWDTSTKLQWAYQQLLGLDMLNSQFGANAVELLETGFDAFSCIKQNDIYQTNANMKEITNVH